MFRLLSLAWLLVLVLAGCGQLPPTPQDVEAKRFEPVAGKGVIYLVRDLPDISREAASVMLDDNLMGTTYPGTYFRWVVAPGRHQIRGFAGDAGSITLDIAPDRFYFVQQIYSRGLSGFGHSFFRPVAEPYGRGAVLRAELVGGR